MDIISPSGVNKTDKKQASPEFAHESPYFYEFFFFGRGGSLHGFNPRKSSQTCVTERAN